MNELKSIALHYHSLGLNVNCIKNEITEHNYSKTEVLKNPYHDYKNYIKNRQSLEELLNLDWVQAVGIGIVTGFENLRVIDIDGCTNLEFVKDLLTILGLPRDYEWLVKSGSGFGYHLYFFTDEINEEESNYFFCGEDDFFKKHRYLTNDLPYVNYLETDIFTATFFPNNENLSLFEKMDFIWKSNIIAPFSLHKSSKRYLFLNCFLPKNKPLNIELNRLNIIKELFLKTEWLDYYCFSSIGANIESDPVSLKKIKKSKTIKYSKKLFFLFDIETDGLICENYYPEILQISWGIIDESGLVISRNTEYIKSNFNINSDAFKINNIKPEYIEKYGKDEFFILSRINSEIENCDYIISHNLEFDLSILKDKFKKANIDFNFDNKKQICTMKQGVNLFKTKDNINPKFPKLTELFHKIYNYDVLQAHDAYSDTSILIKCWRKIITDKNLYKKFNQI